MNKDLEKAIKKQMEYTDAQACCKNCDYFVPTDCSGAPNAKSAHCKFNPSFELPVREGGRCKEFKKK